MSNRQKCIDMWQWIVDNPGSSKEDWLSLNKSLSPELIGARSRDIGGQMCYACKEVIGKGCEACPVFWGAEHCGDYGSIYKVWYDNQTQENAIAVLDVITKT